MPSELTQMAVKRLVALGEVVLIVTAPVVGTPPDQLVPTVQSVLVAPVQVCACAELEATTANASARASAETEQRAEAGNFGRSAPSLRVCAAVRCSECMCPARESM